LYKRDVNILLVIISVLIGNLTIIYLTKNQNNKIETRELTVLKVVFSSSNSIKVTLVNSGTEDVTINQVRINGVMISLANWTLISNNAVIVPDSVVNTEITSTWTAGNKYQITLFSSEVG